MGAVRPLLALSLPLAMALAGCGESPFDPEVAEKPVPDGNVQVQPGLYRMQVSIGGPQGAGAGSQYADDTTCLTQQDVAGGHRDMLLAMQGRDTCRFDRYEMEGDRLDALMVCAGDSLTPETEAQITGTVTPTASDLTMNVAGFGDGTGGIEMQVVSERIGECEEGAG